MLNHETTSISREKQEEHDEWCDGIEYTEVKYSRKNSTMTICDVEKVGNVTVQVFRQKETYLQGGYFFYWKDGPVYAYTLKALKGKFLDAVEVEEMYRD